jgi:hypothetical protein
MNHVGPSGLVVVVDNVNPDLTVGAIEWRPFGPGYNDGGCAPEGSGSGLRFWSDRAIP